MQLTTFPASIILKESPCSMRVEQGDVKSADPILDPPSHFFCDLVGALLFNTL